MVGAEKLMLIVKVSALASIYAGLLNTYYIALRENDSQSNGLAVR